MTDIEPMETVTEEDPNCPPDKEPSTESIPAINAGDLVACISDVPVDELPLAPAESVDLNTNQSETSDAPLDAAADEEDSSTEPTTNASTENVDDSSDAPKQNRRKQALGRKNIRQIIDDKELSEDVLAAQRKEAERLKRISQKEKQAPDPIITDLLANNGEHALGAQLKKLDEKMAAMKPRVVDLPSGAPAAKVPRLGSGTTSSFLPTASQRLMASKLMQRGSLHPPNRSAPHNHQKPAVGPSSATLPTTTPNQDNKFHLPSTLPPASARLVGGQKVPGSGIAARFRRNAIHPMSRQPMPFHPSNTQHYTPPFSSAERFSPSSQQKPPRGFNITSSGLLYRSHMGHSMDDAILLEDSDEDFDDFEDDDEEDMEDMFDDEFEDEEDEYREVIELSDPEDDEVDEADLMDEARLDAPVTPDHLGRIQVNRAAQEGDTVCFLAPQIARTIKPHQVSGIRFLYDNVVESTEQFESDGGFGCILAHSMGLGKTIQIVAFLDILFRYVGARSVLIIVPINTLQNWQSEIETWLPHEDDRKMKAEKEANVSARPSPSKSKSRSKKPKMEDVGEVKTDEDSVMSATPVKMETEEEVTNDSNADCSSSLPPTHSSTENDIIKAESVPFKQDTIPHPIPHEPAVVCPPIVDANCGEVAPTTEVKGDVTPVVEVKEVVTPIAEVKEVNTPVAEEKEMVAPVPEVKEAISPVTEVKGEVVGIKVEDAQTIKLEPSEEPSFLNGTDKSKAKTDAYGQPLFTQRPFKMHVIKDTLKTMESRCQVVKQWQSEGGVMLIGYEMFRLLVGRSVNPGTRKPPTSMSEAQKKAAKKPIRIDMEAEEKKANMWQCFYKALVNPGPQVVICDEGHRIKNSEASTSKALKAIKTHRRVVMTGYPLQNNLIEYWCMVDFVRPNYLGTKANFTNMFQRPIENGQCVDSTVEDRKLMLGRAHVLHELLEGFVQRRSHAVLRASLPRKQEYVLLVKMSPVQRRLYACFMESLGNPSGMLGWAQNNTLKTYATCCKIWNHPDILWRVVQEQQSDAFDFDIDDSTTSSSTANLTSSPGSTPRSRATTAKSKQRRGLPPVASTPNMVLNRTTNGGARPTPPMVNGQPGSGEDKHHFAQPSQAMSMVSSTNSMASFDSNQPLSENPYVSAYMGFQDTGINYDWLTNETWGSDYALHTVANGGKVVVFLSLLRECVMVGDKMLLFSQSLLTLDLLEEFLKRTPLPEPLRDGTAETWNKNDTYYRLDGSTSASERERLINSFNVTSNRAKLFLLSTRAGCLGVNLVGANRVVVFDASWNPCHDCQAVCRVYRYGQIKQCYIYRLVTDNTMEKKIYDRQVTKQGMSDRVVDELNPDQRFTKHQVEQLMDYEDKDLPCISVDQIEAMDTEEDPLLSHVLKENASCITTVPFTHESLLIDRKDYRLTRNEKKRAKQRYEEEKRQVQLFQKPNYLEYYRSIDVPLIDTRPSILSRSNPSVLDARHSHSHTDLIRRMDRHSRMASFSRQMEEARQRHLAQQAAGGNKTAASHFGGGIPSSPPLMIRNQVTPRLSFAAEMEERGMKFASRDDGDLDGKGVHPGSLLNSSSTKLSAGMFLGEGTGGLDSGEAEVAATSSSVLESKGCKILRIKATTDLIFPGTNTVTNSQRKIERGELMEVIQTSKGKYLRVPRTNDLYVVRTNPNPSNSTPSDSPAPVSSTTTTSTPSTTANVVVSSTVQSAGSDTVCTFSPTPTSSTSVVSLDSIVADTLSVTTTTSLCGVSSPEEDAKKLNTPFVSSKVISQPQQPVQSVFNPVTQASPKVDNPTVTTTSIPTIISQVITTTSTTTTYVSTALPPTITSSKVNTPTKSNPSSSTKPETVYTSSSTLDEIINGVIAGGGGNPILNRQTITIPPPQPVTTTTAMPAVVSAPTVASTSASKRVSSNPPPAPPPVTKVIAPPVPSVVAPPVSAPNPPPVTAPQTKASGKSPASKSNRSPKPAKPRPSRSKKAIAERKAAAEAEAAAKAAAAANLTTNPPVIESNPPAPTFAFPNHPSMAQQPPQIQQPPHYQPMIQQPPFPQHPHPQQGFIPTQPPPGQYHQPAYHQPPMQPQQRFQMPPNAPPGVQQQPSYQNFHSPPPQQGEPVFSSPQVPVPSNPAPPAVYSPGHHSYNKLPVPSSCCGCTNSSPPSRAGCACTCHYQQTSTAPSPYMQPQPNPGTAPMQHWPPPNQPLPPQQQQPPPMPNGAPGHPYYQQQVQHQPPPPNTSESYMPLGSPGLTTSQHMISYPPQPADQQQVHMTGPPPPQQQPYQPDYMHIGQPVQQPGVIYNIPSQPQQPTSVPYQPQGQMQPDPGAYGQPMGYYQPQHVMMAPVQQPPNQIPQQQQQQVPMHPPQQGGHREFYFPEL